MDNKEENTQNVIVDKMSKIAFGFVFDVRDIRESFRREMRLKVSQATTRNCETQTSGTHEKRALN